MLEFTLTLKGEDDSEKQFFWRPHSLELLDAERHPVSLAAVGKTVVDVSKAFQPAFMTTPENPIGKTRAIRRLKIQLGMKCNFSCSYCNQAWQPHDSQGNPADVAAFFEKLPTWFDGGENGMGEGVRVEFWGGEPFAYWKILKPLAEGMRERYPNAEFLVINNGSLIDAEKVEWLDRLNFLVCISHDGPAQSLRGPDPLTGILTRKHIKELYKRLAPKKRIGFNTVLHNQNPSLDAVRAYIAKQLSVDPAELAMTTEGLLLTYDGGAISLSPRTQEERESYQASLFDEIVNGQALQVGGIGDKIEDFFNGMAQRRPIWAVSQKCGMDRPDAVAVTLKGVVLTCQNTSADDPEHNIGTVDDIEAAAPATSRHFLSRESCTNCPVVQLCQGSCMFLNGEMFEQSCANSFAHNLTLLAAALQLLTGMRLVAVEREQGIRHPSIQKVSFLDSRNV